MDLIVSPHFDDGILSCADHMVAWRKGGSRVVVLTLFSEGSPQPSQALLKAEPEAQHWQNYMAMRRDEECVALRQLQLEGAESGLVDAGFRGATHPLSVPRSRFGPQAIPQRDQPVFEQACEALRPYLGKVRRVVVPVGLGGHVDHLIARRAGEAVFHRSHLSYFADMPYAADARVWANMDFLRLAATRTTSRLENSIAKRHALGCYVSQSRIIGRMKRLPSELLLLAKTS